MNDEVHAGGVDETKRFWEGHYQKHERRWSGRPNPVLVDVVGALQAGTVLDLGCGEGGDAIWLAGRGWRVTAVDVSATALDRASAEAVAAGVGDRIDFQRHDLAHTFPAGVFDLVSAQYLHSPIEFPRAKVLQKASSAVTPGGLLLIVDHASVSPRSWAKPEETLTALDLGRDKWHVERLEARERETTSSHGKHAKITDNIIAVRRRVER